MIFERLRPYLLRIILIVVVITGLSLFLYLRTYGWIEITVPKDTAAGGSVDFVIRHDDQITQEIKLTAGQTKKIKIKTGLARVDSNGGPIHSVDMVRVASFGTTKLTAPTGEQHAVKQMASDLHYCPLLVGGRIYSYDCLGEGPILKHNDSRLGNTRNSELFDGRTFSELHPVKDGLIGFSEADESEEQVAMVSVNLVDESVREVALPSGLPQTFSSFPDVAVSNDPNSSRFALLYTQKNQVYLFDDVDDKNPVRIEPKKGKTTETGRVTRGSFSGDRFVLYLGTSNDHNEGSEVESAAKEEEKASNLGHFVIEYDLEGKERQVTYLPADISSQGIYKLSNDFYIAADNEGFDFYYRKDNGLEQVYSMTGLAGWTIRDGKAYMQNNNILYEFVPKANGLFSLNSRFSSASIDVSQVFNTADGIVFTGFATKNSTESANLYQLLPDLETALYEDQKTNSQVEPDYRDLRRLTNGSISAYHAVNLQYALDGFLLTQPSIPRQVLIGTIVVTPHDRLSDDPNESLTFDMVLDNTQRFKAKLDYSGLMDVNLRVYDTGGNQLYESGAVTGAQPGDRL